MTNPPTLVLVHGSWHTPACYDPIIELLQSQHKLKCIAVALPSTTGNPLATFKDDIDVTRAAISDETSQGRDVVVIAHSYGGMVGGSAIKGFAAPSSPSPATTPQSQSQSQSQSQGHVIGLILIASGFVLNGLAFMDPFFGQPPPSWRVNSATGFAELVTPPRELFYHDLPDAEAELWVSRLTSQSLKALFEGGEHSYAGWQDVPVWYIGTVEDRGLPVLAQRMGVGMAREMGGRVEHRELQSSHSPFLSQPGNTVRIICEAVGAFMGVERGEAEAESESDVSREGRGEGKGERAVITVPRATLWKPLSWLRFGLPLAFGHVLGRSILFFTWGRRLWRGGFR